MTKSISGRGGFISLSLREGRTGTWSRNLEARIGAEATKNHSLWAYCSWLAVLHAYKPVYVYITQDHLPQ